MKTILFVCHGNICRSTTAEQVFKEMLRQNHLEDLFHVESAGLSAEETGNPIYPPAADVLREHNIPVGHHRAHRLTMEEARKAHRIYYMDRENLWLLRRQLPESLLSKCEPLLPGREIADPWYSDNFELAFNEIEEGCQIRLKELLDHD